MEKEIWKDIPGYEGLYKASNLGRIKSLPKRKNGRCAGFYIMRERILKPQQSGCGYLFVRLATMVNGKINKEYVHRVIATAFITNPNNLPQINHKDENRTNNHVDNLEWCDAKYNMNYNGKAYRTAECHRTKVAQYTLNGEYITTYPIMTIAAISIGKTSRFASNISACCKGTVKSSHGYIWKYA